MATGRPSVSKPNNAKLNIVSRNENVTLSCTVTGDDITSGYWERVDGKSLQSINNMSSINDDKTRLQLVITKAHPKHSGKYRCIAYSQWGVAQSRGGQVTITSESNNVLMQ